MDVIGTLGIVVAGLLEVIKRASGDPAKVPSWLWHALALLLGVIITYGGEVQGALPLANADWNRVLTGLGVGVSASLVYKGADLVMSTAKAVRARAGVRKEW